MNPLDLLPGIWGYVAAGVGVIAALIGAWFKGTRDANAKHELERLNNYVERRNRIEDAVRETDGMSDDDVAEWLRKRSER